MLKQIALNLDDQELYKLACELEKRGALDLAGTFNAAKLGIQGLGKGIVNLTGKVAPKAANMLGTNVAELGMKNTGTMVSKLKPMRAYQSGIGAMALGH